MATFKDSKYTEFFSNGNYKITFDNGKTYWDHEKIKQLTLRSTIDTTSRPITDEQREHTEKQCKAIRKHLLKLSNSGTAVIRFKRMNQSTRVATSFTKVVDGKICPTQIRIKTDDLCFNVGDVYFFSTDLQAQVLSREVQIKVENLGNNKYKVTEIPELKLQFDFIYYFDDCLKPNEENKEYEVICTPSDRNDSGIIHVAIIPKVPKINCIKLVLKAYKVGIIGSEMSLAIKSDNSILKGKDFNKQIHNTSPVFNDEFSLEGNRLKAKVIKEKKYQPNQNYLFFNRGIIGTPRRRVLINKDTYATGFISDGANTLFPKFWNNTQDQKNMVTVFYPVSKILVMIKPHNAHSGTSDKNINGWSGNIKNYDVLPKKLEKLVMHNNKLVASLKELKIWLAKHPEVKIDVNFAMQIIDYIGSFDDQFEKAIKDVSSVTRKENARTITVKMYDALAVILDSFQEVVSEESKLVINQVVGNVRAAKEKKLLALKQKEMEAATSTAPTL